MAVTTKPSDTLDGGRVARFDPVERLLHWTIAAMFAVLVSTAAVLYVGSLSALVGRRELVRVIHVWTGLLLPVPVILAAAGPWRRGLRADVRLLNRWDDDDRRWMRSLGRDPFSRPAKFNAGQKLNAAFVAGAAVVMLLTGSVMHWFALFPVDWRTGATFVHDWLAIGLFVAITGHVLKALGDPVALRGMMRGWVPAWWARANRPRWVEEPGVGAEER